MCPFAVSKGSADVGGASQVLKDIKFMCLRFFHSFSKILYIMFYSINRLRFCNVFGNSNWQALEMYI